MSKALIIAEHDGSTLNPSTAKCVTCAREMAGDDVAILVLADSSATVAAQAAQISGVARVLTIDRSENQKPVAALLAPQIAASAAVETASNPISS